MLVRATTETLGAFPKLLTIDGRTLHADMGVAVSAKRRGIALDRVTVVVTHDYSQETDVLTAEVAYEGSLFENENATRFRTRCSFQEPMTTRMVEVQKMPREAGV